MTTIAPILKYPGAKWRMVSWLHAHAPRLPRARPAELAWMEEAP